MNNSLRQSQDSNDLNSIEYLKCFNPATFIFLIILAIFGAIIGIQLLTTLGVTPNTAIIGALIAMLIARIPLFLLRRFRSVHVQNLAQSTISAATFGAANCLLMPIAIPYVFGRSDLVIPLFIGVSLAMLLDGYLLYRMFNTNIFPASGTWPPGVAAAEAIKAGDKGGRQAKILSVGIIVGAVGAWFRIPMAALGTAFIGNIWALFMLGVGFLLRGYSIELFKVNINELYIPHGIMVGAGLVALLQVIFMIKKKPKEQLTNKMAVQTEGADSKRISRSFTIGALGYMSISMFIAVIAGLYSEMSLPMLLLFICYAAFAAFVHEIIVGIAAMHSGWFPAFAVALITLIIGIVIGFSPVALVILCGFSAATGPAFADMGYDLKAGYMLRNNGKDLAFETFGRRNQFFAASLAFLVAIPVVYFSFPHYFEIGAIPPVAKVYTATIQAGISPDVTKSLLLWAIPGAIIQLVGGPKRQMGVLLATGLLIANPLAGWAVMIGIAVRILIMKLAGEKWKTDMEVFAAGLIAGDAIFNFFNAMFKANK